MNNKALDRTFGNAAQDEAETQEQPSDEIVYLSNQPVYWQFGYSDDGRKFFFVPDFQFEEIIVEFVDNIVYENVSGNQELRAQIMKEFKAAVVKWQSGALANKALERDLKNAGDA